MFCGWKAWTRIFLKMDLLHMCIEVELPRCNIWGGVVSNEPCKRDLERFVANTFVKHTSGETLKRENKQMRKKCAFTLSNLFVG